MASVEWGMTGMWLESVLVRACDLMSGHLDTRCVGGE